MFPLLLLRSSNKYGYIKSTVLMRFRPYQSTSIKEWFVEDKAQYIAKLIDDRSMSYEDVMRKIGADISRVRYYYISYRLFLQMEDILENFSAEDAEFRFSTMFFCLQTLGVQQYLGLDISADPSDARIPIPKNRLDALAHFTRWLSGSPQQPSLVMGLRNIADFGRLLENPQAVQYLFAFLKDIFQASMMHGVEFLILAVRNDYRGGDDFQKVYTFLETLYISSRLVLPLKGIILIGY